MVKKMKTKINSGLFYFVVTWAFGLTPFLPQSFGRFLSIASAASTPSAPIAWKVSDSKGSPLPGAMVTESLESPPAYDQSDNGYPKPLTPEVRIPDVTRFTDASGSVKFPARAGQFKYRFRKFGFQDLSVTQKGSPSVLVKMTQESDPHALAAQKPANSWLSQLEVGSAEDKSIFKMQCGFCHQQGSLFTRQERTPEAWSVVIQRMVRYGARLPSDLQKTLPEVLSKEYRRLRENPSIVPEPKPIDGNASRYTVTEWPVGDSMSQTHDTIFSLKSGLAYVADNIQDRIYELNEKTNEITVHKIPHREGEKNGGLLSARLKDFPKHDSTSNAHSLAESEVDGHIFITPSAQRRLVEFDPKTKTFTLHEMSEGFYPHTIRIDQKDRVWCTLALSNQVAMFDRKTGKFTYYDLPARGLRENLITGNIGLLYKLMDWGLPLSSWLKIDRVSTGVPLVYGIDVTPDGKIWVARLHTKEIGVIDPDTGKIEMIETPFLGPRRLRADNDGNLWIGSFGESKVARYRPKEKKFDLYDLPVVPLGSETPYSLNVDRKRNRLWVNGNQSDSLYVFDIPNEKWIATVPFPRRTTFTRDVEFSEDGSAYVANSNFPSWHVEGSQPTLLKVSIE
jgi:virginiamycin B lyase